MSLGEAVIIKREIKLDCSSYRESSILFEHFGTDVNGTEIEVSSFTANSLDLDNIVTLETHLIVREDAQILFGFKEASEKKLFQMLIKINGVGPRLAIGIMSGLGEDQFSLAIRDKDVKILTALPGVGKKTAERLIIELQDKMIFERASGEKTDQKFLRMCYLTLKEPY